MAIVARVELPAEGFALAETFRALPDLEVDYQRYGDDGGRSRVDDGADEDVTRLLLAYGVDRHALEEAFEADATVGDWSLLTSFGEELIFDVDWADGARLETTTAGAVAVLDAHAGADGWQLFVVYPDREALEALRDLAEDHRIRVDVRHVPSLGHDARVDDLTRYQREALSTAYERGYFDVPRGARLDDLAEELGISHQALSERLRRGHNKLVRSALHADVRQE